MEIFILGVLVGCILWETAWQLLNRAHRRLDERK